MKMKKWYGLLVCILALASTVLACMEIAMIPVSSEYWFDGIELAIQLFFLIDYIVCFRHATDKKSFFLSNLPSLFALIPYVYCLRFFRLARILAIFHAIGVVGRSRKRLKGFWTKYGLINVAYLCLLIWGLTATVIFSLEQGVTVQSYPEAFWWAFSTGVCLGGTEPVTAVGHLLAFVDVLSTLSFMAYFTGNLVSFLIEKNEKESLRMKVAEANVEVKKELYILLAKEFESDKEGKK